MSYGNKADTMDRIEGIDYEYIPGDEKHVPEVTLYPSYTKHSRAKVKAAKNKLFDKYGYSIILTTEWK